MPVFTFSGKTASGEKVQGERIASTKDGLASQLRKEHITPGSIREKGKEFALPTFGSSKVKVKDVAVFFRQFSVMIDAGLPLVQCLEILGANQENPSFQKTLLGVRTGVEGGATLANAMRQYPTIFDDLSTNMVEAGETGAHQLIIHSHCVATEVISTGPSKPEGNNGELALYGFTSAKVYFVVASGCWSPISRFTHALVTLI